MTIPHVVIIGGGFAGITCARRLKAAKVRVTLFDSRNHHLFQPLLYQVATAALSAPDIAAPIRNLLAKQKNATVLARAVDHVDLPNKRVVFDGGEVHYDQLVLAAGAVNFYYGHPEWEAWAPGLKTIDDAFEIRRRVLGAFEEAELEADPELRKEVLTFAVVGGGATGVELAGALAEIATRTMRKQFQHFDPEDARIVLIEGGSRLLNGFPDELGLAAKARLTKLGVEVRLDSRVEKIDRDGVHLVGGSLVLARTCLWGAGITASPLGKTLGVTLDRGGRVPTDDHLHPVADATTPTTYSDVFVCGDMAAVSPKCNDGKPIPGVAPAAIQMGKYAADQIVARLKGKPTEPYRYFDKGQLATIGRASAVAALGKWKFHGRFAWLLWVVVHILYLASFRNRVVVLFEWAWAWFSWSRPGRIILERGKRWPPPADAATAPPAEASEPPTATP